MNTTTTLILLPLSVSVTSCIISINGESTVIYTRIDYLSSPFLSSPFLSSPFLSSLVLSSLVLFSPFLFSPFLSSHLLSFFFPLLSSPLISCRFFSSHLLSVPLFSFPVVFVLPPAMYGITYRVESTNDFCSTDFIETGQRGQGSFACFLEFFYTTSPPCSPRVHCW